MGTIVDRSTRTRVLGAARRLPILRRYPATRLRASVDARRLGDVFDDVQTYVQFVGYPRSGHSLVGALLDAHPDMVVAHELDALKYVEAGFDRDQLFSLLIRHQRSRAETGMASGSGYTYAVDGQWQGRFRRLRVIGDKKGGRSTRRLAETPGLLDRLAATVRVPVTFVHVVRNPFDNIATMASRAPRIPIAEHADTYFRLAATVDVVRAATPRERFLEVRLEELTADPTTALRRLCDGLGVDAEDDYLASCAALVFPRARTTRGDAAWTDDLLASVERRAAQHEALQIFSYDGRQGG